MTPSTFRHTVTYRGPYAVLVEIAKGYTTGTVNAGDGVTRTATMTPVRPVTPTPKPRPANWSAFRLSGAIAALTELAITRLPDPRDDADLREACRLLTAIRRRQGERKASS